MKHFRNRKSNVFGPRKLIYLSFEPSTIPKTQILNVSERSRVFAYFSKVVITPLFCCQLVENKGGNNPRRGDNNLWNLVVVVFEKKDRDVFSKRPDFFSRTNN